MESQNPEIRCRINYNSTLKEGWRFEHTVEINLPYKGIEEMQFLLEQYSQMTYDVGMEEVRRRNQEERG